MPLPCAFYILHQIVCTLTDTKIEAFCTSLLNRTEHFMKRGYASIKVRRLRNMPSRVKVSTYEFYAFRIQGNMKYSIDFRHFKACIKRIILELLGNRK